MEKQSENKNASQNLSAADAAGKVNDSSSTPDKQKNGKEKKYNILQPANKKGRHVNGLLMFLRIVLLPIVWLMYPFRFYGKRRVPDGPYIYIGNHYRIWDVAFPPCTTTEGIHYLAKSELKDVPVVGAACRGAKVIFLERNGDDVRGLMDALRCLKNGEKIAIYPEGKRNKSEDGELLEFHSGAAMLAIKTRTPVVPIVCYEKTRMFHLNHILIGEPFELKEYYGQKLTQEVLAEADARLRDYMIEMRDEHTRMLQAKKIKKNKTTDK